LTVVQIKAVWRNGFLLIKKIEDFITGMNLGYNVSGLRETFVINALLFYMKSDPENFNIKRVNKLRAKIKDEMNWVISDKALNNAIAVECLGESITAVGEGRIRYGDYLKKQRDLEQKGFSPSLDRQIKWFIKYVIAKKIYRNLTALY
jgi:hypothetical protein